MRSLFLPPTRAALRAVEATAEQIVATGASLGGWGADPVDGDTGWKPAGRGNREVPYWTREKAATYAVAAYRYNPMARAIIDTYTSFAVGDSGVTYQCTNPEVERVVDEFWNDPRNNVGAIQDLWLRTTMLTGEDLTELMVAEQSGATRFCPIDPGHVQSVECLHGNPLWPQRVTFADGAVSGDSRTVVAYDDVTGLRTGEVMFWAPFRTLMTDQRGISFLAPILDQLDAYDMVISNLIDRTAMARYIVWDVTLKGATDEQVKAFIKQRGGTHMPPAGSVEVHNDSVEWKPQFAPSGAVEDSVAASSVLTGMSAGAGLAKTWLAEPDGANRATSLSMAEPVRRRVRGVQKLWLGGHQTELVRFAVDQAVRAHRLPATVTSTDAKTGSTFQIPASQSVTITGPEVAAADAQVTAQMLLNLSTGLKQFVEAGVMSTEASKIAARKAWEQFVGVPWRPELDGPDANPDDIAQQVEDADTAAAKAGAPRPQLRAVT